MGHDQRRAVHLLDHFRHGVSLARPGNAQQHLMLLAIKHTPSQRLDGSGLVAFGLVIAD